VLLGLWGGPAPAVWQRPGAPDFLRNPSAWPQPPLRGRAYT
jgi:hypothetical protein